MAIRSFADLKLAISYTFIDDDYNDRNFDSFESTEIWPEPSDTGYILRGSFRVYDSSYFAKKNLVGNYNVQFAIGAQHPFGAEVRIYPFGFTNIIDKSDIMKLYNEKVDKIEIPMFIKTCNNEISLKVQFMKKDKRFVVNSVESCIPTEMCDDWYKKFAKFVTQVNVGPTIQKME